MQHNYLQVSGWTYCAVSQISTYICGVWGLIGTILHDPCLGHDTKGRRDKTAKASNPMVPTQSFE